MKGLIIAGTLMLGVPFYQCLAGPNNPPNIIKSIKVSKTRVDIIANDTFRKAYLNHNYYAEYQADIDLRKFNNSILTTGFLSAIIPALWVSGKKYLINEIDEDFFESLKVLKKVYKRMYPSTPWNGELIPKKVVKNIPLYPDLIEKHKNDIALAFSGGLDSITSSIRNNQKHQLLVIGRGPVELHSKGPRWAIFYKRTKKFADGYGHEIAWVNSNRAAIIKGVLNPVHLSKELVHYWQDLADGLSRIGLMAPILLTKGYPVLFIASTLTWRWPYAFACSPLVDDNIRIGGMQAHHDSFDLERIEKQELLKNYFANQPQKKPYCLSCANPWKTLENCNSCEKCLRTMLGFVLVGENPNDYGFNLSTEEIFEKSKEILKSYFSNMNPFSAPYTWVTTQKYLKEKNTQGHKISNFEEWFLNFNLDPLMAKDSRIIKGRCDSISLLDLLPESFQKYAPHEKIPQ